MADRITIVQADITQLDCDAIVNAANASLGGGGGVDGAIHRAAGPELLPAGRALAPCPAGEARITPGFRLKARHVIHAVGPVWYGGDRQEEDTLARTYRAALALADAHGIRTIAFPSISTGAYGFPVDRAAPIALREIRAFLATHPRLERVVIATFSVRDEKAYTRALAQGET